MDAPAAGAGGEHPLTYIRHGDRLQETEGAGAALVIEEEGEHLVEYGARDLAGNVSPGARATVRIDRTPPSVAFAAGQDRQDPDRLVALVADGISGVKAGSISYRRLGGGWNELETSLREGRLIAYAQSESMDEGVTYEFRAEATDEAGNRTTSFERADGAPMRSIGPFKGRTSIEQLRVNGRTAARVRVGRPITVGGRLVDRDGGGVPNAPVTVNQEFDRGSSRGSAGLSVVTDADGWFSARLEKGPSRTILAGFAGDRVSLPSRGAPATVRVKSAITLKVRRRAQAGGKARFRGRVRAPGTAWGEAGKRVEIQVRVGKRWKTVGRSIRTNRRGKFKLSYRFVASYQSPVRFTFRAVALKEAGFPFLPSRSKLRQIVVRP